MYDNDINYYRYNRENMDNFKSLVKTSVEQAVSAAGGDGNIIVVVINYASGGGVRLFSDGPFSVEEKV